VLGSQINPLVKPVFAHLLSNRESMLLPCRYESLLVYVLTLLDDVVRWDVASWCELGPSPEPPLAIIFQSAEICSPILRSGCLVHFAVRRDVAGWYKLECQLVHALQSFSHPPISILLLSTSLVTNTARACVVWETGK
jgi:hypothetical protein